MRRHQLRRTRKAASVAGLYPRSAPQFPQKHVNVVLEVGDAVCRAFRCADDSEATAWAKQLIDGHDMELWSGERFIIRLDCKKSSPG
jgi:hypothetical protein